MAKKYTRRLVRTFKSRKALDGYIKRIRKALEKK